VIKKDGLNFVRLYFLNYTRHVNNLPNIGEVINFQIPPLDGYPSARPCSSVSWEQNGYYAIQDFCVRKFIKTESVTAWQRAFRLRFNIQPPTRKSVCRWNHQF